MSKIVEIDGKFYDFGTKNQSFLLTAEELKTVGIKKWYFMLEVKYPNLNVQDIDARSDDLTAEEIGKIHIESKANVWFWLREVAAIPAKGNPVPYALCLTRASCAATWCYIHSINFLLCQPRQTWKTTIINLLCSYAFLYDLSNVDIPFLHIKEPDAVRNAGMFRDYIYAMPKWMNPWLYQNKQPGLKSMKYDAHKTSILVLSGADSEQKAMDKLRGQSLYAAFIDEWEFIPYIDYIIAGAAPTIAAARESAKKTGTRTCIMYASTPGDLDTTTGKAAQRIIDHTQVWTEKYYDMTDEEIKAAFDGLTINGEQREDGAFTSVYIEYKAAQLRKDEKWIRTQYNEAVQTGRMSEYRRGVLLQRFRGDGAALFQQEDIDYLINNQKDPDYDIFIMNKYHLYVYKHEIYMTDLNSEYPYFDINIPYLIGMDIASGSDGDNTTMCVVHPYTLDIVAEFTSPFIGTLDLMRMIVAVAKIIPSGIFCVETNNIGKAIVDFVQESNLESRFYHDDKLDISKNATVVNVNSSALLREKAQQKKYIGTYVTPTTRKAMFQLLFSHVKDYKHLLLSKFLVKDITNLVKDKNGKVQADTGEHDDMVMGYLHAIYVWYYGTDLSRFGIDKTKCSFDKVTEVIKSYEQEMNNDSVNNTKPFDMPTLYEGQVLRDIINSNNDNSVDEYGYSHNQYHDNSGGISTNHQTSSINQNDCLNMNDYSFFSSINTF